MKHFQEQIMQIMRLSCWKILPGFHSLSLHWGVPCTLTEYVCCPKHLLPGLVAFFFPNKFIILMSLVLHTGMKRKGMAKAALHGTISPQVNSRCTNNKATTKTSHGHVNGLLDLRLGLQEHSQALGVKFWFYFVVSPPITSGGSESCLLNEWRNQSCNVHCAGKKWQLFWS